jgi:general secretion pathway protein K
VHPIFRLHHHRSRASALLIALWAIVFVSFTVIGVTRLVQVSQEESTSLSQLFQARQIARNAAVLATHPNIDEGDPILKGKSDLGGTYEVKLVSEGARLNINEVLKKGDREILERLFAKWEVRESDAATAIDSLLDWVDADPLTRLNGAEQDYYQRQTPNSKFPENKAFASVEDMIFVRGMEAVAAHKQDWQDSFTVWSDGKLDVNDAPAELIEAVFDVTSSQAEQLIAVRARMKELPDKKAKRWKDIAEPLQVLGISGEESSKANSMAGVSSKIWRAESTGSLGGKNATVCLVFNKGATQNAVLHRLEK